jgi:TatD DNase family protein
MIIDTHAHLNFSAFDEDREAVIKRAIDEGVYMINAGTKYSTSKKAIEIASSFDKGVYAAVGLHPIHLGTGLVKIKNDGEEEVEINVKEEFFDKEKYLELAKNDKVVAIGEVGLDYWYKPKGTAKKELFKQKQKEVFIQNIEIAKELNLPLIIHCRVANEDLWDIIKDIEIKGVLHCFTGSAEDLERYLSKGLYIGLNGLIFNLNSEEVIKEIPLDRILVETDCPYLTPPFFKEQRNEPLFIKEVVKEVARIKGLSFKEVEERTTLNSKKLFNLNL